MFLFSHYGATDFSNADYLSALSKIRQVILAFKCTQYMTLII